MIVKTAKTAGFCPGVKRAVKMVYEQAGIPGKKIYTYGPIIHNEQVVEDLQKKGVQVLESRKELEQLKEGTVIIRSHGVPKEIYDLIEQKDLELVDATCYYVQKIHQIVTAATRRWKASADGAETVQMSLRQKKKHTSISTIRKNRFVSSLRRHLTTRNLIN